MQILSDLSQINLLLKQLSKNAKLLTEEDLKKIYQQKNILIPCLRHRKSKKIIGFGIVYFIRTFSKYAATIEDVVIDRDYRSMGRGKRLMQKLIKIAKEKEVDFIDLTSNPKRRAAIRLYRKLGFKKRKTNCYRLDFKRRPPKRASLAKGGK